MARAEAEFAEGLKRNASIRAASGTNEQQTLAVAAEKELRQALDMNASLRRAAQPLLDKAQRLAAARPAPLPH